MSQLIRLRLHMTKCWSCVDEATGHDCTPPVNLRQLMETQGMSLVPDREIPHPDTEQPGDYDQ
jgi:hypothetical protein